MKWIYIPIPHWVGDIFVYPDYRGQGIGSEITTKLSELARELGVMDLYLYTPNQELD